MSTAIETPRREPKAKRPDFAKVSPGREGRLVSRPLSIRHNERGGELGPLPTRPERIRSVAVFRALVLGDLLCAVPALRALRVGLPEASIALVGLPWARELASRLSCVDEFIEFPGYPGLPESVCDVSAVPSFLAGIQARRFDLAIQLHGAGTITNPLVAAFGARRMAGFRGTSAWAPDADDAFFIRWPETGHEIDRLLALPRALGMPETGRGLEFPVNDADRDALAQLWPGARGSRPYICVHPGAQLASRRWMPHRFAAVADALAERGYVIVMTGSASEQPLVATVAAAMHHPAVSLAGRTDLWTLGALIEGAAGIVCNDTGVSHIASALNTPSVIVSCGGDVARWAPLDATRHRVLWAPMPCRPCQFALCPEVWGCAAAISVNEVVDAVDEMWPRVGSATNARLPAGTVPRLTFGYSPR